MLINYTGSDTQLAELYAKYRDFDLVVDSRRLSRPAQTLFFALPGSRTDGHDFIPELLERGVRHFVARTQAVPELAEWMQGADASIVTEQVLTVLQDLAAYHRRQFTIPILAITGSNGKTIVKDWLAELLGRKLRVCASPRSFNSQIGVPLSVWQLRAEHEVAIFEAGVSEAGEMAKLAKIIQPTCGVFTLLGSAHAAGFTSETAKHQEKISLFAGAEWVTVSADDNDSIGLLRKMDVEPVRHLGFDRHLVEVDEVPVELELPDLPKIYLENAYSVVAAAFALGVDKATIQTAVRELHPLGNRLEVRAGLYGGVVINDSYSNDYSALAAALDFAANQSSYGRISLILGTLQGGAQTAHRIHSTSSGTTRGRAHQEPLATLLADRVTRLLTVGEERPDLPVEQHFATPEDLLSALPKLAFHNETILVKGASKEGLHRVADALSRQQHRTLLRLDLSALRHNFSVYRQSVDAEMIVMVKAGAYGGGALAVARTLVSAGAKYLAVAYPDEGRELRAGGLTTIPIMVLNAEANTYPLLHAYDLEPVVHDLSSLRRTLKQRLRCHLELDTGMGRLGFGPADFDDLIEEVGSGHYNDLIASVFTHLAASEEAAHDSFTHSQVRTFGRVYEGISEVLPQAPLRHVLNTNGITRFPGYAYEMARLGIGLYGIGDAARVTDLRPALRFSTRVAQVYKRSAGHSIGYNRRGLLDRDSRIAVLSVGYADGLPRLAGEGRYSVLLNGRLAPTIGAVCMDMTMIDVTDLPLVRIGDEAILFGPSHPIELLAEAAQTIPYELLTGIGPRVHRIYSEE